jgi:ADP-ribosylglycohydrolase
MGPYGSWGNGAAMRVSPAGWLYPTLEETEHWAEITARVSHDHPEGLKGARVTAGCIFLARTGGDKRAVREYAESAYNLSRTLDEIRPTYHHVESCQETVPEAITAFLESSGFEDAIRKAVSLGGDADTLTCICGGIAEAAYGIPPEIAEGALLRLPGELRVVLDRFRAKAGLPAL